MKVEEIREKLNAILNETVEQWEKWFCLIQTLEEIEDTMEEIKIFKERIGRFLEEYENNA